MFGIADYGAFVAAIVLFLASPGPGNLALITSTGKGGIRGGLVYGASDKTAAYVKDSPVRPEDFGATLFHALGVAPETRLGADGFTKPVSVGKPVLELF